MTPILLAATDSIPIPASEPETLIALAGLLVAFLLGSIPFAYLLGRTRGLDLRTLGSGNVGATNLGRNAGIGWGVLAFFLDAAKGGVPVVVYGVLEAGDGWVDPGQGLAVAAGIAAVLGHCFSPFLRFRGGKGVATMAGVLCALAPVIFLSLFGVWAALVALRRNVGFASVLTAVAALGVGVWVATQLGRPETEARLGLAVLLLILPWVVIVRHRSNIQSWFSSRGSDA